MFPRATNTLSTTSNQENDDSDVSNEYARVNRVMLPKSSDEYRQRRERNNAAVKKSRFKSKQKTLETQRRVDQLREENIQLERRVESLTRELNFMRDIFVPRRATTNLTRADHKPPVMSTNNGENNGPCPTGATDKTDKQLAIVKQDMGHDLDNK